MNAVLQNNTNKRNFSFDTMRLLLCIFIVSMHFNSIFLPTDYAEPLLTLFFTAVPCFFMLSGYYMKQQSAMVYKSIKKILVMLILSSLLYSVLFLAAPNSRFESLIEPETLKNIIIYNHNPFGMQLWYLSAYLYVLLFFLLYIKFPNLLKRILIYGSPGVVLCMSIIGRHAVGGGDFSVFELRNAYTTGIPYFIMGNTIAQLGQFKTKYKIWLYLGILCLILSLLEYFTLANNNVIGKGDHYIFTLPLSICVFMYFLSKEQSANIFSEFGRKYSMLIFIFHAFPLSILGFACKVLGIIPRGYQIIIAYLIVWAGSLLMIKGYVYVKNRIMICQTYKKIA